MATRPDARESAPPSSWNDIQELALSFDGYAEAGSACAEIANALSDAFEASGADAVRDAPTPHLGYALFFEQRRWRHFGEVPGAEAMRYIGALVHELAARHGNAALWERIRKRRR